MKGTTLPALLLTFAGVTFALAEPERGARPTAPPDAEGAFRVHCTRCHPARKAMSVSKARDEWAETIGRMAGRHQRVFEGGISLRDQERIADYLARNAGAERSI